MVSVLVLVFCGVLLSATCTVKLELLVAVGVPLITPAPESVRPAGNVDPPVRVQVYGVVPPVAVSDAPVVGYAVPRLPSGSVVVVIVTWAKTV